MHSTNSHDSTMQNNRNEIKNICPFRFHIERVVSTGHSTSPNTNTQQKNQFVLFLFNSLTINNRSLARQKQSCCEEMKCELVWQIAQRKATLTAAAAEKKQKLKTSHSPMLSGKKRTEGQDQPNQTQTALPSPADDDESQPSSSSTAKVDGRRQKLRLIWH